MAEHNGRLDDIMLNKLVYIFATDCTAVVAPECIPSPGSPRVEFSRVRRAGKLAHSGFIAS
jgi:hypothetical protein